MNNIPTSKIGRGAVVGKAAVKIGLKKSKRAIFGGDKKQNNEEIADIIFEALSHLKGVSVKIAQHIALGMPFLPDEIVDKISKSFNQITPINRALIRKIIKTELGSYPEEIFEEFELEPFAAASLGQVHKAKYKGKEYAIKVQYPGIGKSINSDMAMLKGVLKLFAKGDRIEHVVKEVEDRLKEELDYTKEAKNYDYFREQNGNSNIIIPKIEHSLSTKRVLAVEFLDGLSLDEFFQSNPSQEQINFYANLILKNFFETLHSKAHTIHADPNPGNFLFLKNSKLAIIDFGCIKSVSQEFLKDYSLLHQLLIERADDKEIVPIYERLNMIKEPTKEKALNYYQEVIKPLDRIYIEPLFSDNFDFKDSNFSKRGFEAIKEVQNKQYTTVGNASEEILFLDRSLLGYYAMFEKMGAKIDGKAIKEIIINYNGINL